jgi:type IV secretion system protein VirD4
MLFGGNSFNIADLGREKTVLFINVSDTDRAFDSIVNIFYTQALQVLCAEADSKADGRLAVPVRMILDDFAASARIPDFDKLMSVIRSREISVSIILQSLSQLDTLYDRAMSLTIINNCDNILYLGGKDMETANFVANFAGKTPEAILSMERDKAYLIRTGEKARLVQKIAPYSTVEDYEPA